MEWPHPRLGYSGRQASGTGLTYASVRSIQVWISMKWFCARTITRHTIASIHTMDHTMDICIMWVWYPSIILNWIWILVLIRWQASLYISSLRVKTFVTYESWGSTSLQVSSHWSNLHRGLKPQTSQTWQDKWQSKILKSSQPTTHARKVKLVVSRRNQSMSILKVLKCFETKNINKNETMRTSAKCHTCQDQGSSISTCFAWQGLCHENLHPAISHCPWACWFGLRRL